MENHSLEIQSVQGELLVDSRLIAREIEIDHNNFLQTVQNYQTQIEQAFGVLLFETEKPQGVQGGRPSRYILLNENQATFVMTLSRNTPAVVQCKLKLVQAFSKAKQMLTITEPKAIEIDLGEWSKVVSLVRASQVVGVEPERLIELERAINPDFAKPAQQPKPKPVKPPTKPDREIIQEFLQNLQTRQWGESLVRRVNTREGVRLAVYMTEVWPKYEAIFCPTFSQSQLRRAIDATGGKSDSVQKFPNARKTMIGRCCVVIPILPKS